MRNRIDLLEGNIFASLTKLALPIMATSFIQMAYSMVDMIWIGRLGSGSVAAVGIAGMYVWLSTGFTTLARMGGQVKVAHSLGAKNYEEARLYAKNSLQLSLAFAFLYTMILLIFSNQLIGFFKLKNEHVIYDANLYLRIISIGLIFGFLNQTITGIVTATGNSKTPFLINTVGLIVNIILDPVLIFGFGLIPSMTVVGAAIATVLAQIIVFVLYLVYASGDEHLFIGLKFISKPNYKYMRAIIKIGLPSAVQGMFFPVINMILSRMVSGWGDTAVAVHRVGEQIESLSWLASEGFASAVNSFVGQNYGADNFDRAKKGYKTSLLIIAVWGTITSSLLIFMPKTLFTIFINEAEAIPYGIDYLVILGFSQLPMCVEIVTAGAFSGFGKTLIPSSVSIIFTSIRIPLAAILTATALGLNGIWMSITVSSILKGIIAFSLFIIFLNKYENERK